MNADDNAKSFLLDAASKVYRRAPSQEHARLIERLEKFVSAFVGRDVKAPGLRAAEALSWLTDGDEQKTIDGLDALVGPPRPMACTSPDTAVGGWRTTTVLASRGDRAHFTEFRRPGAVLSKPALASSLAPTARETTSSAQSIRQMR